MERGNGEKREEKGDGKGEKKERRSAEAPLLPTGARVRGESEETMYIEGLRGDIESIWRVIHIQNMRNMKHVHKNSLPQFNSQRMSGAHMKSAQ